MTDIISGHRTSVYRSFPGRERTCGNWRERVAARLARLRLSAAWSASVSSIGNQLLKAD
ncbi:MAG: hypothetical protein M2R45_02365 [Verrucomicrobia subdivision 3 bacterium]|nr:hypothetical protein [Limisphaerales bacterium]MCS1414916.1 hypothetical protein [Limisphaerales bacterium]